MRMKRTATTPAPEPESGVSRSQQSIGKWVQLKVKTGTWKVTYTIYSILPFNCDVTVYLSGLWVCLACVILIAGSDTVSGLTITNIPSSSLAAGARSVTSQRPEVGLTTAGKYSVGRSSNVIPAPHAFTTPMNEIQDKLWSLCNFSDMYFNFKSKFYGLLCLFLAQSNIWSPKISYDSFLWKKNRFSRNCLIICRNT